LIDEIETNKESLQAAIKQTKSKVLDLAIKGKLVKKTDEWEMVKLEEICDYEQPTKYIVESTDYNDEYATPVLTAGKSFILGYTNETNGIYNKLPVIILDDFTTDSRLVDFPFKVKSSAMKILQVRKDVNIKYVAYFMSITRLIGTTHKRYWISEYSKLEIPLPPLSEQTRIVSKIEEVFALLDEIERELA